MPPLTDRPTRDVPEEIGRAPTCLVGRKHRLEWARYRRQLSRSSDYPEAARGKWRREYRRVDRGPARQGIEREFEELAEVWERETAIESFPHRKAMHPAYQQIIAIGPPVLPLVLRRLERRPGHWFWALRVLARYDAAAGVDNMVDARAAWLDWGRRHGYLSR